MTAMFLLGIIIFCALLFSSGFTTYFHQDDFIQMWYSQTFKQTVGAFNIFQKAAFPFYRPIPTQLYFFAGQKIFGFNPAAYHVFNFLLFALNVVLVFQLIKTIAKNQNAAVYGTLIFAVNATHFAPLHAASYVHELFFVFFGVLTVRFFLKNKHLRSVICFILALMSKETAVVLPGVVALVYIYTAPQFSWKKLAGILIPYTVILSIYLWAHFVYYGLPESASYKLILGKPTLNALVWYFVWSLSSPNIFIDFLERGFHIRPMFYEVTGLNGKIFTSIFPLFMLFIAAAAFSAVKKHGKIMLFGFIWFVLGLIPILIFPLHKLAIEQAFSLVGLSLVTGVLIANIPRPLRVTGIVLYLTISINTIFLANRTHWIARSASQAKNVIDYINKNKILMNEKTVIFFKNGEVRIPQYGSSKQLYLALGEGKGLGLLFQQPKLKVYFEDIDGEPKNIDKKSLIEINASGLLGY